MTATLRLLVLYISAKGGDHDSLERYVSSPESVKLPLIEPPTEEELEERACENDRAFYGALLELAGEGRTRKISLGEFKRKYDGV